MKGCDEGRLNCLRRFDAMRWGFGVVELEVYVNWTQRLIVNAGCIVRNGVRLKR
jgi:hypothetical protein